MRPMRAKFWVSCVWSVTGCVAGCREMCPGGVALGMGLLVLAG